MKATYVKYCELIDGKPVCTGVTVRKDDKSLVLSWDDLLSMMVGYMLHTKEEMEKCRPTTAVGRLAPIC